MVHIYAMEYSTIKNKIMLFAGMDGTGNHLAN
jgi:hypothetical protein